MAEASLGAVVRHVRSLAAPGGPGPTDGALLHAFTAAGDRDAFAALVRRHGPLVLGVCRRVLRHQQDAEDAFQATFLLLARAAGSVRKRASLASWLHGVAYRMAKNAQRAAARRRRHEGRAAPAAPPNPAWEAAWHEVQALLDAEIDRLPAACREPFVLCCLENQPCAEVARRLGVKEGTVWSRLAKARETLRARLARRGVELPAVLAAAALAPADATAAVPPPLAAATVTAALSAAQGVLTPGAVAANVIALVKGANGIMTLKTKLAVLLVLTAGVFGTGLGTVAHRWANARADEPPAPKAAEPPAAKANAADPPARFGEGWSRTVEVPPLKGPNGDTQMGGYQVRLWVEQGWLVVRRETAAGEPEWQVVLARADDPRPPQVGVEMGGVKLDLRYGSYFIREYGGLLRVLRERKTDQSPPWPHLPVDPKRQAMGSGGDEIRLAGWEVGDWCWATSGPASDRSDVWLRLQHKGLRTSHGFAGARVLAKMEAGSKYVQDEGDLLVAERAQPEEVQQRLLALKIRKELQGGPAPALVARQWLNAPGGLELEKLRGKVVLLDFWGTWCGPCVQKLPRTEELHQKYKDRGLVVIGVHSAQGGDKAGALLKEKSYTFPVAVDQGPTAERYAVEAWPTYFLIDKSGKVVWGFAHEPPKEIQIEELLR